MYQEYSGSDKYSRSNSSRTCFFNPSSRQTNPSVESDVNEENQIFSLALQSHLINTAAVKILSNLQNFQSFVRFSTGYYIYVCICV